MARRSRRSLAALLAILAAVGGCASEEEAPPPSDSLPATTSIADATTTTDIAGTTTSTASVASTTEAGPDPIDALIGMPGGDGPFPAVVLVHGGGWVTGAPGLIAPLADHLTQNGFLTVNTRYFLSSFDRAGFPDAVEDVACAVRFAAAHPASDGTVAVIGHSAGAHLGALVALTGDRYPGDCPYPGSGLPERFIGLAGPYDVTRLGIAVAAFFGSPPNEIPEAWEAGNPMNFADANPELSVLLMYGELDGIVTDDYAAGFHDALVGAGVDSFLELVEGARHNQVHDPELVGDLIVTWLRRET